MSFSSGSSRSSSASSSAASSPERPMVVDPPSEDEHDDDEEDDDRPSVSAEPDEHHANEPCMINPRLQPTTPRTPSPMVDVVHATSAAGKRPRQSLGDRWDVRPSFFSPPLVHPKAKEMTTENPSSARPTPHKHGFYKAKTAAEAPGAKIKKASSAFATTMASESRKSKVPSRPAEPEITRAVSPTAIPAPPPSSATLQKRRQSTEAEPLRDSKRVCKPWSIKKLRRKLLKEQLRKEIARTQVDTYVLKSQTAILRGAQHAQAA
ncbi:hypothetical protein SPRG_09762 [Saprolegnia parasitica CBS 223.65]|uniref:Uncharacterized protein n=1 Tax=Saprolegnia parasitica (strain CBS 223.65) TaxID=695850 RepID=A0A067C3C4_SAPPC|nr:hypothetical protein SPRG_09762 [Saprolegnia parasitica CBS 223.65]KDO25033.1 hypothetical protein SPRG_09762 [Saprolegnia parasitica CBS 223.65]|eukprot:XP_012204301.1 hypothetical protein SPRG_09762 [Saprolegnia parasitica CBS 223.65]